MEQVKQYDLGQTLKVNNTLGVVIFSGKEEFHIRTAAGFVVDYPLSTEVEVMDEQNIIEEVVVLLPKEKKVNGASSSVREPKVGSKVQLFRELYNKMKLDNKGRKEIIQEGIAQIGLTKDGAQTYYFNESKRQAKVKEEINSVNSLIGVVE